jgi:Ca2+-binding EF-hand superfamily protein
LQQEALAHEQTSYAAQVAAARRADSTKRAETALNLASQQQKAQKDTHNVEAAKNIMESFDTDRDGKISIYELMDGVDEAPKKHPMLQGWQRYFNTADDNDDMHLSVEELSRLLKHSAGEEVEEEEEAGANDEQMHAMLAANVLDNLDEDGDGRVSLQELLDNIDENTDLKTFHTAFKEADANRDMHLTRDELEYLMQNALDEDAEL